MKLIYIISGMVLTAAIAVSATAQDLHIHYDAQTENLRYVRKGKTIHKPRINRGATVFLHVENFNNYLYDVKTLVNNREVEVPQTVGLPGANGLAPGGGASGFLGLFNFGQTGSGGSGLLTFGDNGDDSDIFGFAGQSAEAQKFIQIKNEYREAVEDLNQLEVEIAAIEENINRELEASRIHEMVLREVNKLKTDPRLKPEQIKKLTGEYMNKVFNVSGVEEVDLSYVLERTDTRRLVNDNLQKLQKKEQSYSEKSTRLTGLTGRLKLLAIVDEQTQNVKKALQNTFDHSREKQADLAKDIQKLEAYSGQIQQNDLEYLTELRYEFEAISGNDFSKTFRSKAAGDKMIFEVTFRLKESVEAGDLENEISVAPIEIPVSGGFKVNTGLGLTFSKFKNTPKNYFVRDSLLAGEDSDNFIPSLTSFVHFYRQARGNVSLGGTVGIGLPITGGSDLSAVSFFGGASLILGKGERIVLSGGMMTAKTERLAKGYREGDWFTSEGDLIPLRRRYESGYFLGLSYNLR